jgi:hypothetical protein
MPSKEPIEPRSRSEEPLWHCPKCDRQFANRNQTHTCGLWTLAHHFDSKPPRIRAIYDQFARVLRGFGPIIVLPEKTRIAFQVRMSFAQLSPRRNWVDGHLILARRAPSPRFRQIETFSPRNHLHAFRLVDIKEIDAELIGYLHEAYRVGSQEHLAFDSRSARDVDTTRRR